MAWRLIEIPNEDITPDDFTQDDIDKIYLTLATDWLNTDPIEGIMPDKIHPKFERAIAKLRGL